MPAVLVGVGVAEHDLLHVAAQRDQPAVRRVAEQVVEDRAGLAQLVDRLQQRHEADPGDVAGRSTRPASRARSTAASTSSAPRVIEMM